MTFWIGIIKNKHSDKYLFLLDKGYFNIKKKKSHSTRFFFPFLNFFFYINLFFINYYPYFAYYIYQFFGQQLV